MGIVPREPRLMPCDEHRRRRTVEMAFSTNAPDAEGVRASACARSAWVGKGGVEPASARPAAPANPGSVAGSSGIAGFRALRLPTVAPGSGAPVHHSGAPLILMPRSCFRRQLASGRLRSSATPVTPAKVRLTSPVISDDQADHSHRPWSPHRPTEQASNLMAWARSEQAARTRTPAVTSPART